MSTTNRRRWLRGASGAVAALLAGKGQLAMASDTPPSKSASPAENGLEKTGPVEAEFRRDYEEPGFKPSWKKPQVNREMAADFIVYAHMDLAMTEKLLDREPGLLNASVDWGAGDFETALGGASHMGQRDIVEMLLGRGARPDLFTLAMLGQLDALRGLLTLEPKLIDAKGPHGFSLHFHAQVGGDEAKPVLDYLQSVKEVELRPMPWVNRK